MAADRVHSDDQPCYHFDMDWRAAGGYTVIGYLGTLTAALLISAAFLAAPVVAARKSRGEDRPLPWPCSAAFAILGAGFMSIEVGSIQKFELFLGYPSLTLAVILLSLLVSTGVGSYGSNALYDRRILSVRSAAFLVVGYGLGVLAFLNHLIYGLLALHLAARIAIIAMVLFPLGALLGTFFPQILRQLGPDRERFVPLAWALNGIFSVASSNPGALLCLFSGASTVFGLGLACYGVLGWAAPAFSAAASGTEPRDLVLHVTPPIAEERGH